jgi:hypothetical protein
MKRPYFVVISLLSVCAAFSMDDPIVPSGDTHPHKKLTHEVLESVGRVTAPEDLADPVAPPHLTQKRIKEIQQIDANIRDVRSLMEISKSSSKPSSLTIASRENWLRALEALKEEALLDPTFDITPKLLQLLVKYDPAVFAPR